MEESPSICALGARSQLRRNESSNGGRRDPTNTLEAADRAEAHHRAILSGVISDFVFESMKRGDILMIERRQHLRFAMEAGHASGVGGEVLRHLVRADSGARRIIGH